MPIPQFTVIPSRDRPATFSSDGDTHLSELQAFVDGANALEQSLQLVATTGTSTTSASIGTGSKSLTTQTGKAWIAGSWLYIVSSSSITNTMQGQVTAYDPGTGALTVNVTSVSGAGTFASWAIGLSVVDAKLGNATNTWLVDSAGADRQYFLSGGSTYFKGYGAYPFVLKNGAGLDIFNLTQDGRATLLAQGTNAMDAATVQQVQNSSSMVAVATGTADALVAAFTPAIITLPAGLTVLVRAPGANTSTAVTIHIDSNPIAGIVKGANQPLDIGDIAGAGHWLELQRDTTLGVWVLQNPATGVSPPPSVTGAFKNLKLSTTGTSAPVTVTADEIVVSDGAGYYKTLSAVSLSVAGTSVGVANGLDAGSLATNQWYSVWVIWNGAATAGLLSVSDVAPTLPSGYSCKARVGWIRTDSTGNKYPFGFTQLGRRAQYKVGASGNTTAWPTMATHNSNVYTAVGVSSFVPATASSIKVLTGSQGNSAIALVGSNSDAASSLSRMACGVGSNYFDGYFSADILLESSNIYFASNANPLQCIGWEDNL